MTKINFIIYLLTLVFMQIISSKNYSKMTNQKFVISLNNILIILFFSSLLLINNLYNITSLRFFTAILITTLLNLIIFKNKIFYTLFYMTVYGIIAVFVELLLSPLMSFNISNIEIFNNNLFLKVIFTIINGIVLLLLFKIKNIIKFIQKIKMIFSKRITYIILIIITLLLLNLMLIIRGIETNNIYLIYLTINIVIFMLITEKMIINDNYNLKILNDRNKNLKDSYKAYSKTIEDCREFKHNLKNELYGIKSLLPKEGQEQLNNILQRYNYSYEWINKIDEIPEGLQGLIYLKKKEAEQKKINIVINTNEIMKTNTKDYIDLCHVIGILLDNAIEASIKTKSKIIELSIINKKDELNIRIINNHKNKIDLMKIGKKNYSTKDYKSGLGLNYVKKLKNPKIKVNFKIINNLFITDVKYK